MRRRHAATMTWRQPKICWAVSTGAMAISTLPGNIPSGPWTCAELIGFVWGMAATPQQPGRVGHGQGQLEQGEIALRVQLGIAQHNGRYGRCCDPAQQSGYGGAQPGPPALAHRHFQDSLDVAIPYQMGYHTANAYMGMAQVCVLRGDTQRADELLAKCRAQAQAVDARELLSDLHRRGRGSACATGFIRRKKKQSRRHASP